MTSKETPKLSSTKTGTDCKISSSNSHSSKSVSKSTTIIKNATTEKVRVHFVAVGSAPLMKKNKFQIDSNQSFAAVNTFLRKVLKVDESNSLFLYCNAAFIPSPDERIGDLNECFSVRGELVVHYSFQEAWG